MKEKAQQTTGIMDMFKKLEIGNTMKVPISLLNPSQPDDGKHSRRISPIEVCLHSDRLIIITGNHRYWELKRAADQHHYDSLTEVRKVIDHYMDF